MSLVCWRYYRRITITNSGSTALTDYQIKVSLDNTNFDFSKANSDGSDIRFTDDDGSTLINFWIESWDSSGQTATIWVKVPSISASSSKNIYMYYGNVGAINVSSFVNTFIEGDRFNRADNTVVGNTEIGGLLWTERQNAGSGVDFEIQSNALVYLGTNTYPTFCTIPFNQQNIVVDFDLYVPTTSYVGGMEIWKTAEDRYYHNYSGTVADALVIYFGDGLIETQGYSISGITSSTHYTLNTWHKISVRISGLTAAKVYVDGIKELDFTCSSASNNYISFFDYRQQNIKWDNFRVREYTNLEPTISIGAERESTNVLFFGMNF